jgi:hypothetical protein
LSLVEKEILLLLARGFSFFGIAKNFRNGDIGGNNTKG